MHMHMRMHMHMHIYIHIYIRIHMLTPKHKTLNPSVREVTSHLLERSPLKQVRLQW